MEASIKSGFGYVMPVLVAGILLSSGCARGRSEVLVGGSAESPSALTDRPVIAPPASPSGSVAPIASASTGASSDRSVVEAKPMHYKRASKNELKSRLTTEQYEVTQEEGTEPPFHNEYWNNHEPGIYVDVTTGEPLFSSTDKFESGTGWPSFTRPIDKGHVMKRTDTTLGMSRDEVRSSVGDAHLGHVFDDGPAPTGLRYCINSASLRFIPVSKLEAEGYGEFMSLFKH